METWLAAGLFVVCLVLSLISSTVLSGGVDRLGARLGMAEGLMGLVTALAADAPEVSSAVTALVSGQRDMGLGVVFGSNLFNLAMLLGLTALLAGRWRAGRASIILNSVVALLASAVATALLVGVLGGWSAAVLFASFLVPYAVLLGLRPNQLKRLPLPGSIGRFLCQALERVGKDVRRDEVPAMASWVEGWAIVPALTCVVLASVVMVKTATVLGERWNVPHIYIGTLVLATVTGIPNVVAALRLAFSNRGGALLSEALNSNNANVLAGVCLPALVVGMGAPSLMALISCGWVLGLTLLTAGLAVLGRGLSRWTGSAVIGAYAAFVVVVLVMR